MAQTINDSTVPTQHAVADANHAAATVLSQQVNLMEQLHLKDPGKQTTTDLLQNGWINVTPLDQHSAMNDPHKFLATASKMVDRAPGGNLNYEILEATASSPSASNDEKTVAKTLDAQYANLATDDPNSWKRFTKYFGFAMGRAVREDGLDGLKKEESAADAFAKHPELTGPQSLAYAFKDIFEGVSGYKANVGFSRDELANIAGSSKYTDQERAAAELVKLNFAKFSALGGKDATTFNTQDLIGLAKIGLPPGFQFPGESCEKSDPATNAVAYAVAAGLISKALGSKQSLSNAMVAGASAAIATEVKNTMCD
jgi:hypothetical protein